MSASPSMPARASSAAAAAPRRSISPPCARRSTRTTRARRPTVDDIVAPLVAPVPAAIARPRAARRGTTREGRSRARRRAARAGEARAHRADGSQGRAASIPYITRNIPLTEILSEEGLAIIEHNAETILQEIGIEFKEYPRALELFKGAGADVNGARVRFPRGLARQPLSRPRRANSSSTPGTRSAPCRSAARTTVFAPVYGSPFVHDLDQRPPLRHDRGLPRTS